MEVQCINMCARLHIRCGQGLTNCYDRTRLTAILPFLRLFLQAEHYFRSEIDHTASVMTKFTTIIACYTIFHLRFVVNLSYLERDVFFVLTFYFSLLLLILVICLNGLHSLFDRNIVPFTKLVVVFLHGTPHRILLNFGLKLMSDSPQILRKVFILLILTVSVLAG